MISKKTVIVVGGGFAGIQFAKTISGKYFEVYLFDKVNHHQFQPLFYQVATSQIEPSSISFPLRNIFRNQNHIHFRLAAVKAVNQQTNTVETTIGNFTFDFLVLAQGCETNFFGNQYIKQNAFTLKSTYDAIKIRNHILQIFEQAISALPNEKAALLNLVIVGGGPTGVELAGAFAEIKNNILPKDYHDIDFSEFTIYLIEGSNHTLNAMSPKAQIASENYLKKLGVTVLTNKIVDNYLDNVLTLKTGETIKTNTVIWAAGVIANTIDGFEQQQYVYGNRLHVNRINQVKNTKNIFAIGDVAYMETPNYPKGHPQVANVAINQAKLLAKNLHNILLNKPLKNYTYKNLGTMATIGTNKAVVDLPFIKFKGYIAWLVWMFLHLMLILSVKNKLIIFINWAWAYLTRNTSLRLILTPPKNKTNSS